MAALSVVAANVRKADTTTATEGIAGGAVDQGEVVYLNGSNKWVLADNSLDLTSSTVGIALSPATGDGDNILVQATTGAKVYLGVSADDEEFYVLGSTAGEIEPVADLSLADKIVWLGTGDASGNFVLNVVASGGVHS